MILGLLVFVLVLRPITGPELNADRTITLKGIVVAFHRQDRDANIREAKSIGDRVERWVVRVDKPDHSILDRLILVSYRSRADRISDIDIDKTTWQFKLRRATKTEQSECIGK